MSMEECPKTTDARNESQPEQQGEMSAAKSPDMFMYFLKGDAGRMRARHDPSSSCSLISRALLDKRQCADDICQDDDMSDQCSHGARIGIFEHYIQKSTESIPVTFCVVEYEMGYPIIVGRVVQEVPKTSVVDTTVAEGQPFGPLVPGNETNEQKRARESGEKKRKADVERQCDASNKAHNKKPRKDDSDSEGQKSKKVAA